jgi:hypothetical protein
VHIILVSDRLATTKTLSLTPKVILSLGTGFLVLVLLAAMAFSWLTVHFRLPLVQDLVLAAQRQENLKTQEFMRENLNVMAGRLGEMQAQLLHLDSMGERLSVLAGMKPADKGQLLPVAKGGGQGGPLLPTSIRDTPIKSSDELHQELDRMAALVDQRVDFMRVLENQLMDQRIKKVLLPTTLPIQGAGIGSGFGVRSDPIAGVNAMHEGVDFAAEVGSPVVSAAGGVVEGSMHPQYGNLIEIDHGNGFSTRYAHLSKINVRVGQLVKRGQLIAATGNTGRSTGPHLHFEVRFQGVAQNPARFLQQGTQVASRR